MFKKLFLSATVSLVFTATSVFADDLNQLQEHRSTINQQQNNQLVQPLDNQVASEIKQNQSATPINPPATQLLLATPPTRINPQTPQTNDPASLGSLSPSSSSPDTTNADDAYPDTATLLTLNRGVNG